MLKFIVLSDLHLVDQGKTSHGLDTYTRLEMGIHAINERHDDADFCLLAGDLADLGFDGAVEPYNRLKELLSRLVVPYHITIGNHDRRSTFASVFGDNLLAETGFVDKAIDAKGYRVIMLDSVIEESHGGHLDSSQLEWLRARLAEHQGPVVVVLHHHANPLHTNVDEIILDNGIDFVNVLKTHNDIRQIIAGHVHYTSCGLWHGLPFTTVAGTHYNVTIPLKDGLKTDRLWGPAQIAVVLGDEKQTLVHFDNFLDANPVLS